MSGPVIVAAAALTQHTDEHDEGLDAIGLMVAACREAEAASGGSGLLERAGTVIVPRGTWRHPDPGRLVAEALGATGAETVVADVGVLQTTVLSAAVEAVSEGRHEIAVVVGGEALDRRRVARRHGRRVTETTQDPAAVPDLILSPRHEFRGAHEAEWGIEEAYVQYALMDSARRARLGLGIEENRERTARTWSDMSRVAAANPLAWDRTAWEPADLLDTARPGNRALAEPYSVKLVTQMHVDQAAAIIVCSAAVADRAGIAEDRRVHPLLTVDSELSVPMVERTDPGACPQWGLVAREIEGALGGPVHDVDVVELYSCFPVAVAHQRDAFGLGDRADVTVTGGMTFGGGPLNNAALQAMASTIGILQERPKATTGLVTAVSGLLTKQGAVAFRKGTVADGPYRRLDLTDESAGLVGRRDVVRTHTGTGRVEAITVVTPREGPAELLAVVRTDAGEGTVARSTDQSLVETVARHEWIGRTVELREGEIVAHALVGAAGREEGR